MSNRTKVKKRDGRIEPLDLDKMHLMVEEATKGLAGVSASQVEMKSGIQFYNGITTGEIQEILIRSASDLIDLDHPNYQFVAARLLLFAVRKQLYGKIKELLREPRDLDQQNSRMEGNLLMCGTLSTLGHRNTDTTTTTPDDPASFRFTYRDFLAESLGMQGFRV